MDTKHFYEEKIPKIYSNKHCFPTVQLLLSKCPPSKILPIVYQLSKSDSGKKLILEHITIIVSRFSIEDETHFIGLQNVLKSFTDFNSIFFENLGRIFLNFAGVTLKQMDEPLLYSMQQVFSELFQGYCLKDLSYCNHIGDTTVFFLGNYVIKLGSIYKTYEIPQHELILKPMIRHHITLTDGQFIKLEISPILDTKSVTEEDCFQLFCKLRKQNIYWTDPKIDNVGFLLEDYQGIPKGTLLVLDVDFLYGNPNFYFLEQIKIGPQYKKYLTKCLMLQPTDNEEEDDS